MVPPLDLTVVMPVYNEQDSLPACLTSWTEVLAGLSADAAGTVAVSWEILALDDGSTDNSGAVLADLAEHPGIRSVSKHNEGHGPTILRGYHEACGRAEWVFQVDSDDEMPASSFPEVWAQRSNVDAVFAVRTNRDQSRGRRIISVVAARTARLLYGAHLQDVNVPYRLMKSSALQPVIDKIPGDTFAPNVVVAGALSQDPARIAEVPVPHVPRRTGEVSIVGMGAAKAALRSFFQTVALARRFRS